ncbi:carboxylesterase family protein [Massilia sp. YIM B02763]|uniref:carboxylesterase/lipase family protein n=1 Tax=Massilia sp. YIM B02763 TaxID=3050130 RepID=UPI0025B712FA|nr:carboxylesterase family protein [Massilia sp. YIM B02763]MDN4055532.1 carboxylesterase family protein [Massilia sp. YIM B02763]
MSRSHSVSSLALALACLAATGAASAAATAANSTADAPLATLDSGKVAGASADGVASWKGIPFAQAPVGPLRWRAPQPVAAWDGVRDARNYGSDCMQLPFPSDAAPLGTAPSEDCLFVNVWKPTHAKAAGKLPVIVWIYGGGFVNGGSSPPTYSGAPLAKQGAVVVSFNYRLGRFGFFAHPQLTREAQGGDSLLGNYAFMDQLAALKWVQRNAGAFGGDPANVTIIGESAGGMAVNTLLTSPLAQGLFAKAAVLSGGEGRTQDPGLAKAEQAGVAFGATKGIAADDPQAQEKLRALPPDAIVDGMNLAGRGAAGPDAFTGPFVDGRLAVDSLAAFNAGRFARVPVMIGATSADIGGKAGFMVAGARSLAATLARQGVPVYAYRFSYVADSLGKAAVAGGARHATDIPYFFATTDVKYGDQATRRDIGMGKTMSAYLVNFAKKGDPNGKRLPSWPRYDAGKDAIMDFSANGKAVAQQDPWGAEIDAARAAPAAQAAR